MSIQVRDFHSMREASMPDVFHSFIKGNAQRVKILQNFNKGSFYTRFETHSERTTGQFEPRLFEQ